jgi:hypothetical protein
VAIKCQGAKSHNATGGTAKHCGKPSFILVVLFPWELGTLLSYLGCGLLVHRGRMGGLESLALVPQNLLSSGLLLPGEIGKG